MSNARGKRRQGSKDSRIKPTVFIPPHPTRHHKRVDQVLSRHAQSLAGQQRAEHTHQHHYRKLIRVTESGNRVMACNCGDYRVEGPQHVG